MNVYEGMDTLCNTVWIMKNYYADKDRSNNCECIDSNHADKDRSDYMIVLSIKYGALNIMICICI
jgi:hypothetical protein